METCWEKDECVAVGCAWRGEEGDEGWCEAPAGGDLCPDNSELAEDGECYCVEGFEANDAEDGCLAEDGSCQPETCADTCLNAGECIEAGCSWTDNARGGGVCAPPDCPDFASDDGNGGCACDAGYTWNDTLTGCVLVEGDADDMAQLSASCTRACALENQCYDDDFDCAGYCSDLATDSAGIGEACVEAETAYQACLADLSCDQLDAFYNDGTHCGEQENTVMNECKL